MPKHAALPFRTLVAHRVERGRSDAEKRVEMEAALEPAQQRGRPQARAPRPAASRHREVRRVQAAEFRLRQGLPQLAPRDAPRHVEELAAGVTPGEGDLSIVRAPVRQRMAREVLVDRREVRGSRDEEEAAARPHADYRRRIAQASTGGQLAQFVADPGGRLIGQFALPLVICICLAVCLAALGFLGYQRVAASDFFEVKKVAVVGSERSSRQSIEAIVRTETERSGVWRADLQELKAKIEKLPFVKTVSVTRVLPGGLRVQVVERQPQASESACGWP